MTTGGTMHYMTTAAEAAEQVELAIDSILMDDACQMRPSLDEGTVEKYRSLLQDDMALAPPRVLRDEDGSNWLYDGFHTIEAARRSGRTTITCLVDHGTRRDAILRATSANADHGLPRSPETIRRAIYTILDDPEWSAAFDSVRAIGRHVGVSHETARRWHAKYLDERGLTPKAKPKGNPPAKGPVAPGLTGRAGAEEPEAIDDPEQREDGWESLGEEETPEAKADREWAELLSRAAGVLGQLAPARAAALEEELAFQADIAGTVKLLRDQWRRWGGRKRSGPFSARVAWLAECPELSAALACLDCSGTGEAVGAACPACKGNGYHIRG